MYRQQVANNVGTTALSSQDCRKTYAWCRSIAPCRKLCLPLPRQDLVNQAGDWSGGVRFLPEICRLSSKYFNKPEIGRGWVSLGGEPGYQTGMSVSLWPVGLQQEMPAHHYAVRRHVAFLHRVPASHQQHQGRAAARCLATRQHVAEPVATEPQVQPSEPSGSNGVNHATVSQSSAYPFTEIESKWRGHWLQHKTFATPDITNLDTSKPKFYALDMYADPPVSNIASSL